MAWIKLHGEIWESHKLPKLCEALNICEAQAIGHLVSLWCFAERNAWRDGDLSKWGSLGISKAGRWHGVAHEFCKALEVSGFMSDGKIHEWEAHQSELIYVRSRGKSQQSSDKIATKSPKAKRSEAKLSEAKEKPITTYAKPAEPDFAVEPAKEPEPYAEALAACQKIKNISPAMLASWRSTYPGLDLISEIQKADTWAVSNNKTCSRWGRFVNNWLKNAQKGPVDTRTGQSSKSLAQVSLDPLAVALCECWLENQTGKAPDKTTAEATCRLYYNDIKQYLDLWRDDLDGAAAFLSEFAQEKRKQGHNRWPLSWATKAAALKVAEKEAGR
jgi:hypothetical protein